MTTVRILVGTTKGVFFLRSSGARAMRGSSRARIFPAARSIPWPMTAAGSGRASGRAPRACTGAPSWSPPTTGGSTWDEPQERISSFRPTAGSS